jgi:gamma-glutamylcyclotransferase (GGCT)/AIG2-like uncharacterized protein YtfP
MINKIFVYGTLHDNPGNRYSRFLERNANYMGVATKKGKLFSLGHYPGAVKSHNPNDKIKGYLYSVENIEYLLKTLDEYEGFDKSSPGHSLFIREKAIVEDRKNKKHIAWIYWYNKATNEKKEIEKGDFFAFKEKKGKSRRMLKELNG